MTPATPNRWLLPEGISEALPDEAARLEHLRRRLLDVYARWGYEMVIPPFIEYLDSLLTGVGADLDLQIFKLTDQLSGRMMGVRADMTPQVARIEAHSLKRDAPVRLCYLGTVLHTRPDGFARSRAPLQIGAELYGHSGIESDAEILALMLETLCQTGIREFHVDLGHASIYRTLATQAALSPEQERVLFEALQRKAVPELREYLHTWQVGAPYAEMLTRLVHLNGGLSVLGEAREVLAPAGENISKALEDLSQIAVRLDGRHALHVDLAEVRGFSYHTGPLFAAYVSGHGEAIAQGGRYDHIGEVFGRSRPATGFSVDLKTLVMLEPDVEVPVRVPIFAPSDNDESLRAKIHELRAQGETVIRGLPGEYNHPRAMGCTRELVKRNEVWCIV